MKSKNKKITEYKKELVGVLSTVLDDRNFMNEFLLDMLTPAEFETLALRWQIIKRLNAGETHREIAGDLGIGIGTVTRGSRELRNTKGGFRLMLEKLNKRY